MGLENAVPKALFEVGGQTLLDRYFAEFGRCGITEVVYVVGYRHHMIERPLERHRGGFHIEAIYNPDFKRGSIVSLSCAAHEFDCDTVLMDADVYFEEGLLEDFFDNSAPDAFLIDTRNRFSDEECMIAARDGCVVEYVRGEPAPAEVAGEWIGFVRLSPDTGAHLASLCRHEVAAGNTELGYEQVLPRLLDRARMGYATVGERGWVEIDFPEDLLRARSLASCV